MILPKKIEYPVGLPPHGMDVLWRCQAKRYSVVVDPDADFYSVSDPHIEMWWYQVERSTPCGAWIWGGEKFVNLKARKQWACITQEQAFESFVARTKAHIRTLRSQLARVEENLRVAGVSQ